MIRTGGHSKASEEMQRKGRRVVKIRKTKIKVCV